MNGGSRVENPVGYGFPAFRRGAVAALLGNQAANGRECIQVLDDDARIEQAAIVVHDEARYFAQRIVSRYLRVVGPHVFENEFVIELFFHHDDAYFAYIRSEETTSELQ